MVAETHTTRGDLVPCAAPEAPPPAGGFGPMPDGGYVLPAPMLRRRTHPQAVASLVLGLSTVLCSALTGVPAILLGIRAMRDIDAHPGRLEGRGVALAGIVLGSLGCSLVVVLGISSGVFAFGDEFSLVSARAQVCTEDRAEAAARLSAGHPREAKLSLDVARRACTPSEQADLDELGRAIENATAP